MGQNLAATAPLSGRLFHYALLMRLHRPIGIMLLLWPTLWAIWIASRGQPDMRIVMIFVLGVILMRSAGCVINDYADRHIDGAVTRTRDRPMVAGRVTEKEAIRLFVVLCLVAFVLVLFTNPLTVFMSVIGLGLAIVYPFMKRYTHMPQVFLGTAFGWGIPMVFTATQQDAPPVAWLLFVATVMWAVAYDTMYAMVDREDDLKIGVKSTAILFGDMDRFIIAILQLSVILVLGIVGKNEHFGLLYFGGLALAGCSALYQQILMRKRDPKGCFQAFVNNTYFGAAIFAGVVANYQLTI